VFDWIQYGEGNAVVEAVAGSGKTCTMVHSATLFPEGSKSVFLAFNKHIADELGGKLPFHVTCGTMHSLCLKAISAASSSRPEIDGRKADIIIKAEVLKEMGETSALCFRSAVARGLGKMVSLAKNTLVDPKNEEAVITMTSNYSIEFQQAEHLDIAVKLLPRVLAKCAAEQDIIDFDDMIWHVLVHDIPVLQYDWVVVDEAQDLNNLQMAVLLKMIAPTGRCICVGDRYQSIYGFRGANTDAIPLLVEKLDAKVLPLSICYRCPTQHVQLAKELVPQIEAAEMAIPGIVEHYQRSEVTGQLKDGDLVLCRCNAPLVELCLSLISSGVKATIKGRDIGKSLVDLIQGMKAKSLPELEDKMAAHRVKETTKLIEKGREGVAQALEDRCSCVEYICHRPDILSIPDLIFFVEGLFSDTTTDGVICSSVHKAKGLESKSVYLLYPHLMPLRFATTEEQLQQERNIEYVALTRSQNFLAFILEDPK